MTAGTWHAFHLCWISETQLTLNNGILPPDYYAQAEQIAGPMGPDVLTLQIEPSKSEMDDYVLKRRTLVIRHVSDDRISALIEIVSPGNKSSRHGLRSFVEKAIEALYRGYHLLVVDLFPPSRRDPNGIHDAIWSEFNDNPFQLSKSEPLTLAAYSAGERTRAYVEPTAVGRALIEIPLFLTPESYVNVPLETTYAAAYRGVPRRWQCVLDAP